MDGAPSDPVGIYIHIPFCRRKCRYCDFYSRPPQPGEEERFLAALTREIELRRVSRRVAETVYIGGGTPSMLDAKSLASVLAVLRDRFAVVPDAEITIEANPRDVTEQWSEECLRAGFTRISIGVQSVDEGDLAFLGRLHRAEDGPLAVAAARAAGFREIGIDLIYGLPGQTPAMVEERIVAAVERCRPEHVSCYQLTYAADTPLGRDLAAGIVTPLSEDEEYEAFCCVHRVLPTLGYPAYEVSNFAQAAHESRHNSRYWRHRPYLGLGPAAHSFEQPLRSWNVRSVETYCALLESGRLPTEAHEELSAGQLAAEMVMLALRMPAGLDLRVYRDRFGHDFAPPRRRAIEDAAVHGLITVSDTHLRPTLDGLAVADLLAADLV